MVNAYFRCPLLVDIHPVKLNGFTALAGSHSPSVFRIPVDHLRTHLIVELCHNSTDINGHICTFQHIFLQKNGILHRLMYFLIRCLRQIPCLGKRFPFIGILCVPDSVLYFPNQLLSVPIILYVGQKQMLFRLVPVFQIIGRFIITVRLQQSLQLADSGRRLLLLFQKCRVLPVQFGAEHPNPFAYRCQFIDYLCICHPFRPAHLPFQFLKFCGHEFSGQSLVYFIYGFSQIRLCLGRFFAQLYYTP